jgi:hypothetical protein
MNRISACVLLALLAGCEGGTGTTVDTDTGSDGDTDTQGLVSECDNWQSEHPEWIFCDDFESTDPLHGPGRYFEYDDNGGDFVPLDGLGLGGSRGMRVVWQAAEVGAGGLKLGFGRVGRATRPSSPGQRSSGLTRTGPRR